MPGAFLHELWKYHQRVRSNLTSDLEEFRNSNVLTILGDLDCTSLANSGLPVWLDSYISDIGTARVPAFLDLTDFHMRLMKHIVNREYTYVWVALRAVVHGSIAKAEQDFALPIEGTRFEDQAGPTFGATSSTPKYSDMYNADVILQSSDLVNFRVHRSVLVASSPFFAAMFSLPQPQNDAAPNELPVVHLSEDAEVLNSLISVLYPVPPEMPLSSDNILSLLSAAAKYDMDEAQSSIRAEASRRGLLSSTRAEIFRVYAVAYRKGLISEVATAARLTLGHSLTFESLGDALRLFDGGHCHAQLFLKLGSLSTSGGPSKIWVGCPTAKDENPNYQPLPTWLEDCLRLQLGFGMYHYDRFTETIPTSEQLYDKYLKALQKHVKEDDCQFCMKRDPKIVCPSNW
ncbi:hypothetical protein BJV77DRAFT_1029196 [Russula vinacea]|nr:hypothetical protein BJV77DRAFT_1029196 [Russula vinacea]